jgi:hypothetical protein
MVMRGVMGWTVYCHSALFCEQALADGDWFSRSRRATRHFDVRVGVPFERSMQDALGRVARQCVEACPTAALAIRGEASCHCQQGCALEEQ